MSLDQKRVQNLSENEYFDQNWDKIFIPKHTEGIVTKHNQDHKIVHIQFEGLEAHDFLFPEDVVKEMLI